MRQESFQFGDGASDMLTKLLLFSDNCLRLRELQLRVSVLALLIEAFRQCGMGLRQTRAARTIVQLGAKFNGLLKQR